MQSTQKSDQLCNGTTTKHVDPRGFFQELYHFNGNPYAQVSWFSIAPGQLRGGHYHKKTSELFIVLEGEVQVLQHVLDITPTFEWSMRWTHTLLKQSQVFKVAPPLRHAFYSAEGAKVLAFSTHHFNPNESDTYSCAKGLKEYVEQTLK